jgi:hypothetical protein
LEVEQHRDQDERELQGKDDLAPDEEVVEVGLAPEEEG